MGRHKKTCHLRPCFFKRRCLFETKKLGREAHFLLRCLCPFSSWRGQPIALAKAWLLCHPPPGPTNNSRHYRDCGKIWSHVIITMFVLAFHIAQSRNSQTGRSVASDPPRKGLVQERKQALVQFSSGRCCHSGVCRPATCEACRLTTIERRRPATGDGFSRNCGPAT